MNETVFGDDGIIEQVIDNGDGTGTRTRYDTDGTPRQVETLEDLPVEPVEAKTRRTLEDRLRQALDTNKAYLAIQAPTAAQTRQQTERLTRQLSAIIRVTLDLLDQED